MPTPILELDDVSVDFDGFYALTDLSSLANCVQLLALMVLVRRRFLMSLQAKSGQRKGLFRCAGKASSGCQSKRSLGLVLVANSRHRVFLITFQLLETLSLLQHRIKLLSI